MRIISHRGTHTLNYARYTLNRNVEISTFGGRSWLSFFMILSWKFRPRSWFWNWVWRKFPKLGQTSSDVTSTTGSTNHDRGLCRRAFSGVTVQRHFQSFRNKFSTQEGKFKNVKISKFSKISKIVHDWINTNQLDYGGQVRPPTRTTADDSEIAIFGSKIF